MGNSFSNVMNCEMFKMDRLIILMHCAISECHTVFLSSNIHLGFKYPPNSSYKSLMFQCKGSQVDMHVS